MYKPKYNVRNYDLEKWFDQHGGRTINDLEKDEQGKSYVNMWNGITHTYFAYSTTTPTIALTCNIFCVRTSL